MAPYIRKFFQMKAAPGILLAMAALLAMIVENSPLYMFYEAFNNVPVVLQFGAFEINKPLLLWINDGLMAIFFLLIGLEIKREVLQGHLSNRDQIILPAVAALGGLAIPAFIYYAINMNSPDTLNGWAIPAATDIAFALGILMMMGDRVPTALKVCLVAIAIIDDLAAIIIIALFYTADLSIIALALAGTGIVALIFMNLKGMTRLGPYMIVGLFIWACVLKSGVHATLAGVVLGLLIPIKDQNDTAHSPLLKMEHALHPWVVFAVIPLFAFANAGVSLKGVDLNTFMQPVTLGIILGLFVGKQLGVMGLTIVASMFKICKLPDNVTWLQFYGMALLTGIGFTMSLFIGTLAFEGIEHATAVRLGVLVGSLLSGSFGVSVLLISTKNLKGQAR